MATIVSLTAPRAVLIDPTQPTGYKIASGIVRPDSAEGGLDGEFREFAGGRTQLVLYNMPAYIFPVTFVSLDQADFEQMTTRVSDGGWMGALLLLRTIDGKRIFGAYLSYTENPHFVTSSGITHDVTVQFTQVTYQEFV